MAQPSMPHGVFRGKRRGYWDWYVVDPAVTDPDLTMREWQASNAASNPPLWHPVVRWIVFVAVFVAIGIGVPLFLFHAREPGTWILLLISGAIAGGAAVLLADDLFPGTESPAHDPHVMQLNDNLDGWIRTAPSLVNAWELNLEVSRATRLTRASIGNADDGTDAWAQLMLGDQLESLRATQFERVREISARVGFVMPGGGLVVDGDLELDRA